MALGQWINNGTDLSVSLASLENGTTYAFEVRAVGGSGVSVSVSGTATPVASAGSTQQFVWKPKRRTDRVVVECPS